MTPDRVHETLIALAAEPVPDVEASWSRLQRSLPARSPGFLQRVEAWVKRPLVISVATMTLGTGAAYAAGVDPVRDGLTWAWDRVVGGIGEADERLTDRHSDDRQEAVLEVGDERNGIAGDDAGATGNEGGDASPADDKGDDKRGSGGAGGDSRGDDADDRADQAENDADDREEAAEDDADDSEDAAEDDADDRDDAAEDDADDSEDAAEDAADDRDDAAEDDADESEDAAEELEDQEDRIQDERSDDAEED